MTTTKYATTTRAALAWLATLPGLTPAMVGDKLPEDNSTWAASGFVTAKGVGGTPEMYVPLREPVVSIDCYTAPPAGSRDADWNQAENLANAVLAACQNTASFGARLAGTDGFPDMRVLQAHALKDPRPIFGDKSFYAHYQFDLQMYWIQLP